MRPTRSKMLLVAALVTSALPACTPEAANLQGSRVEDLYRFFFVVAVCVFVIVVGLISWSILRYREKPGDGLPRQFEGNVRLEILWFAIPTVLVVVLFVLSIATLNRVNESPPKAEVTVRAEGFQWGWRFAYEGNGVEIVSQPDRPAELVLPTDQPITFELVSDDVVHSFYVPRFLIKRDTIPGKTNRLHVTIQEPGTFRGVCAEFCGLLHASMDFTVRAVPPPEFEAWLSEREAAS